MATAAELLSTSDVINIDVASRTINIPNNITLLGVYSDDDVQKLRFSMARFYNGIDLSTFTIRINYENANRETDIYSATDIKVDTDNITFTWVVSRHATSYVGNVNFVVCLKRIDGEGNVEQEFNTAIATLPVLKGLEAEQGEAYEYPDIIASVAAETLQQAKQNGDFSPVKGVDYFTPEERAEIVEDVTNDTQGVFANALKNKVFGECVQVNDVSPVQHSVRTWVHGKNLFTWAMRSNGILMDKDFSVDAGSYTNGVFNSTRTWLKAGTYTMSFSTPTNIVRAVIDGVYYMVSDKTGITSYTVTLTTDDFFGVTFRDATSADTVWNMSNTVQIEEGTEATEHVEYVNPTDIVVKRFNKNLLDLDDMPASGSLNGVTITRTGDIIKLNGTLSVDSVLFSTPFIFYGVPGKMYKVTCEYMGGYMSGDKPSVCIGTAETSDGSRKSWMTAVMANSDFSFTNLLSDPFIKDLWFYAKAGVSFSDYRIRIQFEAGIESTSYEIPDAETYIPNGQGIVDLVSVSPNMSIFTNTPGTVISCEYNQDMNIVGRDISAALDNIIALQEGLI